jgi:hypothetical protein
MTEWSDDVAFHPPELDVRWMHLGRPFLDLLVRALPRIGELQATGLVELTT